MKRILHILTLFLGAFVLFSCEPGRDENGDYLFGVDYNQGNGNGNRLLTKMISHELNDSGEWEDSEIVFNYNDQRLVSIIEDGESTVITYNSDNKISSLSNPGEKSNFEYSAGTLSKITTTISGVATFNTTFTYTGTQLSKTVSVQEYSFPVPSKLYVETTYEFSGTNLVKADIRSGIYLPNGDLEMNPETQTLTMEYDTAKSPFKLLPKEFILYLSGIAPHGAAYLSGNNFTKFTNATGGVSEVSNYTYIYDTENFPVEMRGEDEEFTKFEYR